MNQDAPGIQYPTLSSNVSDELKGAFKNVFDNLFYILGKLPNASIPNVGGVASNSKLGVESGKYTPRLLLLANLGPVSSTIGECQWLRVLNRLVISGEFLVDPTTTVATRLGLSLPILCNFTKTNQGGGAANPKNAGRGAAMHADPVNKCMVVEWIPDNVNAQTMNFVFMCEIP